MGDLFGQTPPFGVPWAVGPAARPAESGRPEDDLAKAKGWQITWAEDPESSEPASSVHLDLSWLVWLVWLNDLL